MSGFIDDFNAVTQTAMYELMDDAIWIKQAGGSVAIKVEFSSESELDELGHVINLQQPMAGCYQSDVVGISKDDVLAVQAGQYTVIDILPRGDGWVDLMLRVF